MIRSTMFVVAALASLVLGGTALAAPEQQGKDDGQRFKGGLSGTAQVRTLSPTTKALLFRGEGKATHIGKFSFVGGLDFAGSATLGSSGCVNFTGGALILSVAGTDTTRGQIVLHPRPGEARICGTRGGQALTVAMTVDLGIGRFAGVGGTATLTGALKPTSGGAYTFSGEIKGTLTGPDHDRPTHDDHRSSD